METNNKITVKADVNVSVEKAWEVYTDPDQVTQWNHASDDWHSPSGSNDLRVGGVFSYRMEAKDGSAGFDFGGEYTDVQEYRLIKYKMEDGREVEVTFDGDEEKTHVEVTFDAESENSLEMQQEGWQAILDNYKNFAEVS